MLALFMVYESFLQLLRDSSTSPSMPVDNEKLKHVHTALKQKFKGKNLIFGQGPLDAKVVIVSEFITAAEEKENKPLSGPSAKVLNQLLKILGVEKRKVYITNVIKYRPDAGVVVQPKEVKSHAAFLKEEIRTISPQVVITLGNIALNGVGLRQPIENVHGRPFNLGDHELLPTFHPTAALADPQIKSLLEADFAKFRTILEAKKNQPQVS